MISLAAKYTDKKERGRGKRMERERKEREEVKTERMED